MKVVTARKMGLMSCHGCGLLMEARHAHHGEETLCPRCGAPVHLRKPDSLARTWALLIAAIILYVPANALPIMTVIWLGQGQPDTIMSGVMFLISHGQWPLALIIFIASVFVPVLKLIILGWLAWSVQKGSTWKPRDRTRMYRITEFVGRWSMVDVFVVTILVALVQIGSLATIEPGYGASAFAAVVILTMFAAMSFDPRLMWDAVDDNDKNNEEADV